MEIEQIKLNFKLIGQIKSGDCSGASGWAGGMGRGGGEGWLGARGRGGRVMGSADALNYQIWV